MKLAEPFFINLAGTGVVPSKASNPFVPLSHTEIVEDVARCLEAGVQMVHLHARDDDGVQSGDPERYGRLIEDIRKLDGGREVVLCVTTSGRSDASYEARARVLELDGDMKPDMASLTLGSLNFMQSASLNPPDTIRRLAQRMGERAIRPELEVFDLGMANFARVLERESLIRPPHYVNLLLGNIGGAQATALELGALQSALPAGAVIGLAGIGRFQTVANGLGLLLADGVRVGLEDNLWLDNGRRRAASNLGLVQRVLRVACELGRPLAPREQVRRRLGLVDRQAGNPIVS